MMHTISIYVVGALAILITFGLAVFVHEFGHMMFALICGVGVESFAIGMGPRMYSWKWGGIDFSLRWLPVGGFVKLKGMVAEEPEEEKQAAEGETGDKDKEKTLAESSYDDMYALRNKGLFAKLLVFGGGVFMNYVTAVIAMVFLLTMSEEMPVNIVKIQSIKPGSIAEKIGIKAQDRIVGVRIDDKKTSVTYTDDLYKALANAFPQPKMNPGERVVVEFRMRDEAGAERDVKWDARHTTETVYMMDELGAVLRIPPIVGRVMLTSPAWKAKIKEGDRFLAIDDKPIDSFQDMQAIVGQRLGKEIIIKVQRGNEICTSSLTPTDSMKAGEAMIGIRNGSDATKVVPGKPLWEAIKSAPRAAKLRFVMIFELQVNFLKEAGFKQVRDSVGGPIMIAAITAQAAQHGINDLLSWFITFNLLLLMLNALPIPVLDGGFLLLSVIESVIRRPVSTKILNPIYTAFMIFFIGLMLIITFWDVKRFLF